MGTSCEKVAKTNESILTDGHHSGDLPSQPEVINLMDALRKSVANVGKGTAVTAKPPRKMAPIKKPGAAAAKKKKQA
ncbi:hypothetical protein AYO44_12100 [Planctomycetaceae bacterium SCGC AG-212-F19]|nr:hypothetical protein AYO44_12100 [Planctomycetaceae bacterium SCGC AG-212-F19]